MMRERRSTAPDRSSSSARQLPRVASPRPLPRTPVMECLSDVPQHRLRSWTEEFEIPMKDGRPKNCSTSQIVWTRVYGGGWKFGVLWKDVDSDLPCSDLHIYVSLVELSKEVDALRLDLDLLSRNRVRKCWTRNQPVLRSGPGDTDQTQLFRSFSLPDLLEYPIVAITVTYSGPSFTKCVTYAPPPPPSYIGAYRAKKVVSKVVEPFLARAIGTGIRDACFGDTAFYLYSRAHLSGGVCRPMVAYADSRVLSPQAIYFKTMFTSNTTADSDPFEYYKGDYPYESDSDIGDADSEAARFDTVPPFTVPPGIIRHIPVTDVAYNTWAALIFYLYTGKVYFAPLKSSKESPILSPSRAAYPSPSSPKSMFRLAVKIELKTLEDLAFGAINSGISTRNVVEEYFTRFTATHGRVRAFELAFIQKNYDTIGPAFEKRGEELIHEPYVPKLLLEAVKATMSARKASGLPASG